MLFHISIQAQQINIPVQVETNHGPQTIYTNLVEQEPVFITEVEYYKEADYPFGRGIELTTSNTATEGALDLSDYEIHFYCGCNNILSPLNEIGSNDIFKLQSNDIISPETAIWISFENIAIPYSNCFCSDSEASTQNAIVLYDNLSNEVINAIGIQTEEGAHSLKLLTSEGDDVMAFTIIPANAPILPTGYTYQLSNNGWYDLGYPQTKNSVNNNLTIQDFFTLKYLYDGTIESTVNISPYSSFDVTDAKKLIPCVPASQYLYYKNILNNWEYDLDLYDWLTYPSSNNPYIGNPLQNHTNLLTIYFGMIESIDFFEAKRNEGGNWLNQGLGSPFIEFQCSNVKRRIGYRPNGNTLDSSPHTIYNHAATITAVGHEMAHRYYEYAYKKSNVQNFNLHLTWDEAFADIWGVLIEKHALPNLTKPTYEVTRLEAVFDELGNIIYTPTRLVRNLKCYTPINATSCIMTSGYDYTQGNPFRHWFYLISEGPSSVFDRFDNEFQITVCGIESEASEQLFFRLFDEFIETGGIAGNSLQKYEELRNLSLSDAVLNPLQANSSEFPVFANKDYVKAQIKNAWAAVGVGDPDFDTEDIPNTLEICDGTLSTQLTASSEIGQVTWHKGDPSNPAIGGVAVNGISAVNGTLTIIGANDSQNDDYFVKVTYNNVPEVGTCERSKKVAISVTHLVINEGVNGQEEICKDIDFTLTLSTPNDIDQSTIEWEVPPGLLKDIHYTIDPNTHALTIKNPSDTNPVVSHEGTYTVTAECNVNGVSVDVSDEINITITDRPDGKLFYMDEDSDIEIEGGESLAICTGEEITLAASGGIKYKWFEGTSNTPIEEHSNSITLIPTESTTYHVEIFNDCDDSMELSVTVNILGGNNTIGLGGTQDICRHETFLAPDGYDSYTWTGDFGESNGQDIVIDEEPGTYDYTLTATIIEGEKVCTARETIKFTVFDFNENDVPDIDLLGAIECVPASSSNSLTLTDKGDTKYAHWEWRLQGNPNPISEGEDSVEDITSINEPGTYTLMVVRQEGGCELDVTHEVTYADLGILGDMDITPNDPFGEYWKPSDLREDNVITIEGTITVKSGASLVIQSGTIVEFIGENSGIVIERGQDVPAEKGGELRAKNVEFNLSDCSNSGDFWKGIEVFADPTAPHPTDYRLNGSADHGMVILRSGRIENAETGISSGTSIDGVETVEGGAIVDVNGVTFENNLRGVYFGSARNSNEESKVKNCHFLHSAPFPNQSVDNPYQQVVLHALELPVLIEANTFEASANVGGIAARGTGIRVEDAAYMIGHATCTALGNDFVGVFQGIEVYSINTAHEAVSTVNNSFEEVDKGITFSSSAGDIVQFNTFELPIPELANDDSYAILTNGSMGLTIEENTINSGLPGANNIEGIVVRNSNIGGVDGVSLNNNSITGSLEVGTQFEGNNQNINLDCNSYSGFMMDWYIDWEAEIGESQNGAVQVGECDNFAPELALRNIWNDSNQTIFHLFNNSNQAVNLNVAQQYQPIDLDGFTLPTFASCQQTLVDNCNPSTTPNCNFILGHNNVVVAHPIDPTDLTTPIPLVEIIHGKSITDPLSGQPFLGLRKLQAAFWQMMAGSCDRDCAIQLLTAQDEEWSKRLLVATYLNKKETTTANNLLATLPSHHAQALQYHNLMDLLLNYPLDANTESNLWSLAANAHDDYIQTLAESALSIYFGHQFIRSANPIDLNGHNKKAPTETSLLPVLQLQPNPATNQIDISIQNRAAFSSDLTISIYDTNGTHWRTISMAENQTQFYLDVTDLPMGMYFCRLYSEEGNFGMRKLMIVK